ncbi:MAG: hypothetical protein DBP01_18595, partial [gamma proteobacterium symbiont of Ctena orbiculata]
RSSIGFTKQDHSSDGMEVIKKMFTPDYIKLQLVIRDIDLNHPSTGQLTKQQFDIVGEQVPDATLDDN